MRDLRLSLFLILAQNATLQVEPCWSSVPIRKWYR